jgi:hypothetical protein
MVKKQEIRTFELDSLEVRAAKEGEPSKILGHSAVFNKLSDDLGGFRENIRPGAFTDAIKRDDVRALFNHNASYILGRNKAGTLILAEDEKGLAIEIDPPDTQYARDLMVSIGRKDITQMSFSFRIDGKKGEQWEVDGKEVEPAVAYDSMWDGKKHNIVRHVIKARLYDVSPVTYPAYPQTDVKVRSLVEKEGIDYDSIPDNDAEEKEAREIINRNTKPDLQGASNEENQYNNSESIKIRLKIQETALKFL